MNIFKWVRYSRHRRVNVRAFGFDVNKIVIRNDGIDVVIMVPGKCVKAGKCWRPEIRFYPW